MCRYCRSHDRDIGRVFDYLKSIEEIESTYAIFMSDNGAEGASYEALPVVGAQVMDRYGKYHPEYRSI